MNFVNDYEKTGLIAVDMVASIVSHHRRKWAIQPKPLKSICLSPKYFVQFTDWVKWNLEKEGRVQQVDECEVEMYTFDGVEIKMNSPLMNESVYCEYYEQQIAQA